MSVSRERVSLNTKPIRCESEYWRGEKVALSTACTSCHWAMKIKQKKRTGRTVGRRLLYLEQNCRTVRYREGMAFTMLSKPRLNVLGGSSCIVLIRTSGVCPCCPQNTVILRFIQLTQKLFYPTLTIDATFLVTNQELFSAQPVSRGRRYRLL